MTTIKPQTYCSLCRNNGEPERFWRSHKLRDENNKIVCPILSAYTCPCCKQTGLHTLSYCPKSPNSKRARINFSKESCIKGGRSFGLTKRNDKNDGGNNANTNNNNSFKDCDQNVTIDTTEYPSKYIGMIRSDVGRAPCASSKNNNNVNVNRKRAIMNNQKTGIEHATDSSINSTESSNGCLMNSINGEGVRSSTVIAPPSPKIDFIPPALMSELSNSGTLNSKISFQSLHKFMLRTASLLLPKDRVHFFTQIGYDPARLQLVEETALSARDYIMRQIGHDPENLFLLQALYL